MDTPLGAFVKQYFKLPACYKALGILTGFLLVDSYVIDSQVRHFIFGRDGKGGEVLLCKTRINHHQAEYQEERKRWYWHQRNGKFYMPQDFMFNDKLDYKELTYDNKHENTFLNPKDLPRHHDHDAYYFNEVEPEDIYKR